MTSPELASYASSVTKRDCSPVVFDAVLAVPAPVHGVSIAWFRSGRRPRSIRLLTSDGRGGWELLVAARLGGGASDRIVAPGAVETGAVRVEIEPDPEAGFVTVREFDLLVGGAEFDLDVILDDHRDHRYVRFADPRRRTTDMGRMLLETRNTTARAAGDRASSSFVIQAGALPPIVPRPMHVPAGARALLVWTEHADRTTLESHRAAYFGRGDVEDPEDAVGGFVGHGIPVTKSVFVDNPDGVPCCATVPAPQSALRSEPAFLDLCRRLADVGHEICMHAPHPRNSPPAINRDAAAFISREFGSPTWIDHSTAVVHGGLSGQGANPDSPYWMRETWERTGHRFFWQFACEDTAEQRIGSINLQQLRVGDRHHTPLWWRHPSELGDLVSWATIRGGDLDVYTDDAVEELVAERGVCVTHTYPAALYDDPGRNQYLARGRDGVLHASAAFETVLERFASRIRAGELTAQTVRDAVGYWLGIESLRVEYEAGGAATVRSRSDTAIPGLSVALRGYQVDAVAPVRVIRHPEDAFVVLDLAPGAVLRLDPVGADIVRAAVATPITAP